MYPIYSRFLDLDCGPSKEYPSQVEAIRDLRKFCSKLNLPTPLMVNSGRGVHVYWTLSKPVLLAEWLTVAERLKGMCRARTTSRSCCNCRCCTHTKSAKHA